MKFSPDGNYILLGTQENLIMLLDANSGLIIKRFEGLFNPSLKKLANSQDIAPPNILGYTNCPLLAIEFTPDSKYVISGSSNPQKNVFIWNI